MEDLLYKYRATHDAMAQDTDLMNLEGQIGNINDKLDELRSQHDHIVAERYSDLVTIEAEIKAIATGPYEAHGVKVAYRKGYIRASWDNNKLKGYAVAHPEILPFCKETEVAPSVSVSIVAEGVR